MYVQNHGGVFRSDDSGDSWVEISAGLPESEFGFVVLAHPTRGEVMVFSTSGITALQQGTHYIKRMTGLPGETVGIRPPELLIGGNPVTEPFTIGRIVRRETLAPWAPPYAGYQVIGMTVGTTALGGQELVAIARRDRK